MRYAEDLMRDESTKHFNKTTMEERESVDDGRSKWRSEIQDNSSDVQGQEEILIRLCPCGCRVCITRRQNKKRGLHEFHKRI